MKKALKIGIMGMIGFMLFVYTYNEIAKACGVPESTVYSALNK